LVLSLFPLSSFLEGGKIVKTLSPRLRFHNQTHFRPGYIRFFFLVWRQ